MWTGNFKEEVYPVLTPMAVDSSRPFPLVRNKSLNIAALLRKKEGDRELEFAMVQVPSVLPRIVVLPETRETGWKPPPPCDPPGGGHRAEHEAALFKL